MVTNNPCKLRERVPVCIRANQIALVRNENNYETKLPGSDRINVS